MVEDKTYLIIAYLSFFISSIIFSILINRLFVRFSTTLGIRNDNEIMIRWNLESKPAFGGISFYIIFLLSITAHSVIIEKSQYFLNIQFLGIIFASTLGFLMGLYDDAFNTKPLIKLFTQITCGLILISTGTYIQLFSFTPLNYALTLFWVVGMMNSINMLDNMDAIATIVSFFIILTVLLNIFLKTNLTNPHIILLIGVMASLMGFLFYNWYPSKIFMGDTGSQFLGVFLAIIGVLYFWNNSDINNIKISSKQILSSIIIFIIPIIDTTTVVINRISKGKSPFIGGKDHTTHYLSYIGFSDRQVAYIFTIISIISMGLAIGIISINKWTYLHIILFSLYILILSVITFFIMTLTKIKE